MKNEVKVLKTKFKTLEHNLENFDEDLKNEFIGEVLNKFSGLLEESSNSLSYSLRNSLFSPEDIRQEFIEYLLRYTYSEVKKQKIQTGKLWIPYLKRSLRNCSVNLINKYGKGTFRNPILNPEPIDDLSDEKLSSLVLVDYQLLFSEFMYLTLKSLNMRDRLLFLTFVYPSNTFLEYLKSGNLKSSKLTISKYFGFSYSSVLKSFKTIHQVFKNNVDLTNASF